MARKPEEKDENKPQSQPPLEPEKFKVGDKLYTFDELSAELAEAESLKQKFGSITPEIIEMGQHVAARMAHGVDGMKLLKKELEDALAERGVDVDVKVNQSKSSELPTFDLPDRSNATENELAIINALNKVADLHNNTSKGNQLLRDELQRQFAALMSEIKTTEIATSAQVQVQSETGLSLSPAEIREAIRKTGLSNPVDAVFAIPEYRSKAIEKLKGGHHASPAAKSLELIGGDPARNFDPKGKSFSDLIEYAEQNPEAIKNYIPPWERKK